MLRMILLVLPVLLLAEGADKKAPRASLVELAPLSQGKVNRLQNFIGTLYFNQKSDLASETSGKVKAVHFDSGDHVKKGDLLVSLDSAILDKNIIASRESYKEAQANYSKSFKDLKRYKKLLADESIARSEYDAVSFATTGFNSRVNALKAGLDAQLIERKKKNIYAPYSGVIAAKSIDIGEWVNTGASVAQIVNPYIADITVNIPEAFVSTIIPDNNISVTIGNQSYTGKIKGVIPVGNKNTRTFPLKITLTSDKALYEGMQASVSLAKANLENAMLIPRDGVIKRFGQQVIFFEAKGTAQMAPVTIVGFFEDKVAIDAPMLTPGMQIVVKGNERIFPNQPIQATNK